MSQLEALEALLVRVQSRRAEGRQVALPRRPSERDALKAAEPSAAKALSEVARERPASGLKAAPAAPVAAAAPTIEGTRPMEEPRFDEIIGRALGLRLRGG